jgi:ABC-type branched-subunit amino acid transport system substrate-binding protein
MGNLAFSEDHSRGGISTMKQRRTVRTVRLKSAALLAAVALAAGACGGDDDATSDGDGLTSESTDASDETAPESTDAPDEPAPESTDAPDEPAPESTDAPDAPVFTGTTTLMVIAPETDPVNGGIGEYPEISAGARAAAAVVNAGGGINGLEVEIEVCDTKQDTNEGYNCAQKAVDEGVLAVVGMQDSRGTAFEPLSEAGIPNVIAYAVPQNLADPNTYIGFGGTLAYTIGGVTSLAALPDVGSISIVYLDDGALRAQFEALAQAILAVNPDLTINYVGLSPTGGDNTVGVTSAGESDAIFLAMPADAIVQFRKTAEQLGIDKPTSVPAATVQGAAVEQLGDLANGLYAVAGFLASTSASTPEIDAFKAAMAEYEPDAHISDLAVDGYLGVLVVAEALKGADTVDSATLKSALDGAEGMDLGLSPPLQWNTPHAILGENFPRLFNADVVHVQITDGQMTPVTGEYVDVLTGD